MTLKLAQLVKRLTLAYANLLLVFLALICVMIVHREWQAYQTAQATLRQYAHKAAMFDQQTQLLTQLAQELDGTLQFSEDDPVLVVGLQIVDSMSLSNWQSLFTRLQQSLWLEVESMQWRRDMEHSGHWQADIVWQLRRPATLKPEQNWLPINVFSDEQRGGSLLTVLGGIRPAALVQVGQVQQWVHEGGWLPSLAATVEHISNKGLTLRYQSGQEATLKLANDEQVIFTLGEED